MLHSQRYGAMFSLWIRDRNVEGEVWSLMVVEFITPTAGRLDFTFECNKIVGMRVAIKDLPTQMICKCRKHGTGAKEVDRHAPQVCF